MLYRKLVIIGVLGGLASCSGEKAGISSDGGETDLPKAVSGAISGTAAIGAPMSNAKIEVKGPECIKGAEADANGLYSVAMGTCTGPYLISAESAVGKVFSIATDEDVGSFVNITPLTQVVAARVTGTTNLETFDLGSTPFDKAAVDSAVGAIQTAIAAIANEFGAGNLDIRSGAFAADGSKLDKVLDAVSIKSATSQMVIAIKGSTAEITVPANKETPVIPIDSSAVAAAVSAAKDTISAFDSMKTGLLAGINNCLRNKNQECYESFFHPEFKNDGLSVDGEWEDIYSEEMDIQYVNLNLIEMNEDKNEAWVSYTTKERETDGSMRGWLGVTKLKKAGEHWKIYGNQIPHKFRPQPSLIQDGPIDDLVNLKRGINFRFWDSAALTNGFTFKFKSSDLGVSNYVDVTYNNLESQSGVSPVPHFSTTGTAPGCATNNGHCKNFIVTNPSAPLLFPKYEIKIGDIVYTGYIPGLPSLPVERDDVPKLVNLESTENLCKNYENKDAFSPVNISWTLPTGYSVEGVSFNNAGNYSDWDFNYRLNFSDTQTGFGSAIEANGEFNISKIEFRLELRDDKDKAVFLPYSCATN